MQSLVYRVVFPENVKWLCIEFSPECGTAQAEDSLQLYIPSPYRNAPLANVEESVPYWPVLHKFSNHAAQWPQSAVVLPGKCFFFLYINTGFILLLCVCVHVRVRAR